MGDNRKNNGGHSTKGFAGRKSKSEEMRLIELLNTHIDKDSVIKKLKEFIDADNLKALEIYLAYMYGKPKETKDVTITQEQPLFDL
tara:strand:+ start:1629 stop:1886 length:258 start_codon:yes stop_codon:yes gene_type:complete